MKIINAPETSFGIECDGCRAARADGFVAPMLARMHVQCHGWSVARDRGGVWWHWCPPCAAQLVVNDPEAKPQPGVVH